MYTFPTNNPTNIVVMYPNYLPNSSASICTIQSTGVLPIEEIARRDVPPGLPYIFVDQTELPTSEFYDAWEIDFDEPDGYGIGVSQWTAEQEALNPEGGIYDRYSSVDSVEEV
jgi:hypothetical protein